MRAFLGASLGPTPSLHRFVEQPGRLWPGSQYSGERLGIVGTAVHSALKRDAAAGAAT